MGLRLIGFVDPNDERRGARCRFGWVQSAGLDALAGVLHDQVVDEVVFAVSLQELARLEPVMEHCADVGTKRVQSWSLPGGYSGIYLHSRMQLLSPSAPDSELLRSSSASSMWPCRWHSCCCRCWRPSWP